ncbi:MAG: carboxypeptidase regulatory-like domain-containing protein [Crocinitomicaceae bacterium]
MKFKLALTLFVALSIKLLSAQGGLGTISGYVYEESDSTTVIPFARMWVETNSGNRYAKSDLNGKYKIDALQPGVYNLHVAPAMFDTIIMGNITVSPDGITTVNPYVSQNKMLEPTVIVWTEPIITKDIPKLKIPVEDIENSPFVRDPLGLIAGKSSDIQQVEGTNQIIVRGSRPGDAIYYVDGVKSTDIGSLPGISLQGLEAYTGGIPAKYGDTTGGVIILETKSYFDLYYAWKATQNQN